MSFIYRFDLDEAALDAVARMVSPNVVRVSVHMGVAYIETGAQLTQQELDAVQTEMLAVPRTLVEEIAPKGDGTITKEVPA